MAREHTGSGYDVVNATGAGVGGNTGSGVDISRAPGELVSVALDIVTSPVQLTAAVAAQLQGAAYQDVLRTHAAVEEGLARDPADVGAVAGGVALVITGNPAAGAAAIARGVSGIAASALAAYGQATSLNTGSNPTMLGLQTEPPLSAPAARVHWSVYFSHT